MALTLSVEPERSTHAGGRPTGNVTGFDILRQSVRLKPQRPNQSIQR